LPPPRLWVRSMTRGAQEGKWETAEEEEGSGGAGPSGPSPRRSDARAVMMRTSKWSPSEKGWTGRRAAGSVSVILWIESGQQPRDGFISSHVRSA
jgi:hypothetical protein